MSSDVCGAAPSPRTWRDGVRDGVPYGAAVGVLGMSFGVVATDLGFPALPTMVMSALVYAGSAQFPAIGIATAGGGVAAAVAAVVLINSRFLPMGLAVGPSLQGSRARRALEVQSVVDTSWAVAGRGDGSFDRTYLFGHSGVQYVCWVLGTVAGVLAPAMDTRALGLDAVFPAFFLAVLVSELHDRRRVGVALAGAALALLLVPVAPPGLPVLLAATTALVGLRRPQDAA